MFQHFTGIKILMKRFDAPIFFMPFMVCFILFISLNYGCYFIEEPSIEMNPIPETVGLRGKRFFQFSISPNDRWLLFFTRNIQQQAGDKDFKQRPHYLYGNLRILDLVTRKLFKFSVTESEVKFLIINNDCWSSDSLFCVLPPPPDHRSRNCLIIDFTDPNNLLLIKRVEPNYSIKSKYLNVVENAKYTCSDCYDQRNDVEFLRKYVNDENLLFIGFENRDGFNIVSPDKNRIYFQKSPKKMISTLYELDIATGKKRRLTSFGPRFPYFSTLIEKMQISPNNKHIAFQVSFGSVFGSHFWSLSSKLYVINLNSKKVRFVADTVYNDVHWSSDSKRLYFFKCERGGCCGRDPKDHIYFIEFTH